MPSIVPAIEQYRHVMDFADIVPVSALTGENVDLLAERLLAHPPQSPPATMRNAYSRRHSRK